jgi:hypothetical protein
MRRRGDYVWRILTRASTRATPKGWLGHVALLPVREDGRWSGTEPLHVCDSAAAQYATNIDRHRAALAVIPTPHLDASLRLALTPLYQLDTGHLVVWTLDGADRNRLGEVRLRRTPALETIIAGLADGPRPAGWLLDVLAGSDTDRRDAAAGLLVHLMSLSVLQVGGAARRVLTGWRPVNTTGAPTPTGRAGDAANDYVDVYRRAATAMAAPYADRLAALLELALRTMALTDLDTRSEPVPLPAALRHRPRPLLDIARECLAEGTRVARSRPHHHDWPLVGREGTPYAQLVTWLSDHMDGAGSVDISEATLDAVGAPAPTLEWPVDCLLRPLRGLGGAVAVLDLVAPAGLLDARFAEALAELHAGLPQVDEYRGFLSRLAGGSGAALMEVLVPPLSTRAANAVRRPGYARLWTGDPNREDYIDTDAASYVPLSRITLRVAGGAVVTEVDGEPVWPVLHTARLAAPPWDTIAGLLLLGSPQPPRTRWRSLRYSLDAWPDRVFVPRITVGGGLIITPAQWRLRTAALWRPGDRLVDKLARLERLSRQLRIPRLVQVVTDVHDEPLAVDLFSPHSVRVLDRMLHRGTPTVLVRELLTVPDQLTVHDEAAGAACVAELLLRLPAAVPALELARRAPRRRPHLAESTPGAPHADRAVAVK